MKATSPACLLRPSALASLALASHALTCAAPAQVTPTTPTKFDIKPVSGASASAGATVHQTTSGPSVRHITYLTLSPLRQWTSTDGKTLTGKLIAWEESNTATPAPATAPPVTGTPTVLRDSKVRLLIDNKAFTVPLDRLGAEEQQFVQSLHTQLTKKPKPAIKPE